MLKIDICPGICHKNHKISAWKIFYPTRHNREEVGETDE